MSRPTSSWRTSAQGKRSAELVEREEEGGKAAQEGDDSELGGLNLFSEVVFQFKHDGRDVGLRPKIGFGQWVPLPAI